MNTLRSLPMDGFELRDNGNTLTFTGYASTFGQAYDMGWFNETVQRGAFTKTLSENPDVRLLINHDGLPLARTKSGTLKLSQDTTGLHAEASLDASDPDVARVRPKLERGDLGEMSFAFRVVKDEWSSDLTDRSLTEISLKDGDVSIVTYPANPNTSAALRSLRSISVEDPQKIRDLYQEIRAGASISKSNTALLKQVLESLSTIDDENDSAQRAIAEVLGLTEGQHGAPEPGLDTRMNTTTAHLLTEKLLARAARIALN